MSEDVLTVGLETVGVGMLGASVLFDESAGFSQAMAQGARDVMIERRILRIEMALRQAGIEVENLPLPE